MPLCLKFTKKNKKRGKPARDSLCAICDVVWEDHTPRGDAVEAEGAPEVATTSKPKVIIQEAPEEPKALTKEERRALRKKQAKKALALIKLDKKLPKVFNDDSDKESWECDHPLCTLHPRSGIIHNEDCSHHPDYCKNLHAKRKGRST